MALRWKAGLAVATTTITATMLFGVAPASACGGLVGENGTIQLVRTTTLAAWHDGIEHYVTSFEFDGAGESVGSIIPLPAEPTSVERGGDWTLQRLQIEVQPEETRAGNQSGALAESSSVEIILTTEIDALDITVLAGGGDAVGEWAVDNGFFLTPDTPEMLDFYASRSPYFLAAKFDASRAAESGVNSGDGTPIHITMPTPRPWVPLSILGLGAEDNDDIEADIFLLTDDEPALLFGGQGLEVERSEKASEQLLDDLRSDQGMEWVPDQLWLTHLILAEDAEELTYDLSASGHADGARPSMVDAGLEGASPDQIIDRSDNGVGGSSGQGGPNKVLIGFGALGTAGLVAVLGVILTRRRQGV